MRVAHNYLRCAVDSETCTCQIVSNPSILHKHDEDRLSLCQLLFKNQYSHFHHKGAIVTVMACSSFGDQEGFSFCEILLSSSNLTGSFFFNKTKWLCLQIAVCQAK